VTGALDILTYFLVTISHLLNIIYETEEGLDIVTND